MNWPRGAPARTSALRTRLILVFTEFALACAERPHTSASSSSLPKTRYGSDANVASSRCCNGVNTNSISPYHCRRATRSTRNPPTRNSPSTGATVGSDGAPPAPPRAHAGQDAPPPQIATTPHRAHPARSDPRSQATSHQDAREADAAHRPRPARPETSSAPAHDQTAHSHRPPATKTRPPR
jgi:hypothetical protein